MVNNLNQADDDPAGGGSSSFIPSVASALAGPPCTCDFVFDPADFVDLTAPLPDDDDDSHDWDEEPAPPPPGTKRKRTVMVCPEGFTLPPPGSKFYPPPGFGFRRVVCSDDDDEHDRHDDEAPPPINELSPDELTEKEPRLCCYVSGSKELAESEARSNQNLLKLADELEQREDDDGCDTEEDKAAFRAFKAKFAAFYRDLATPITSTSPNKLHKPPPTTTDTPEEHLTAEDMEDRLSGLQPCPPAQHLATLALAHYNLINKTKFEMATALLSKRFRETDGRTFAHVNFTASTQDQSATQPANKRLFFAELMYIPQIQSYDEGAEPMCVIHVCTIDDSCFGGCHEMVRDIKKPLKDNLDYERCHACSDRIKHPRGDQFVAGHDSTRMPYYTVFM